MERSVIVTAANKGIGRAICERILRQDFAFVPFFGKDDKITLVFTTRRPEETKKCLEEFKAIKPMKEPPLWTNPLSVFGLDLDLENEKSIKKFAKDLKDKCGINHVDLLINNAGWASKGPGLLFSFSFSRIGKNSKNLEDINKKIAEKSLAVNYFGTKKFSEEILPMMQNKNDMQKRNSRLVFLSSTMAQSCIKNSAKLEDDMISKADNMSIEDLEKYIQDFINNAISRKDLENSGWGNSCYGFSYCCLNILCKIWAKKFEKEGISVFAVHPGSVKTDMTSGNGDTTPNEAALNVLYPSLGQDFTGQTGLFFKDQKPVSFW